jgi:hypothetical protein
MVSDKSGGGDESNMNDGNDRNNESNKNGNDFNTKAAAFDI